MDDISVIIPVKNRVNIIGRALDSVLSQEGAFTIEIIVVDDASVDQTKTVVKKYCKNNNNIFLIENNSSLGGAAARNIGARAATGNYLAFLDSDDEWEPQHLSNKLELIKLNQAKGCFGAFNVVRNGKTVPMNLPILQEEKIIDYIFVKGGDTRTSTFFFERKGFMEVMFNNDLAKHQDWDLAIRFSEKYKFVLDKAKSVNIYIDVENRMSNSNNALASAYFLNKHKSKFSAQGLFNFKLGLCFYIFRYEGNTMEFRKSLSELNALSKKPLVRPRRKYYLLNNKCLRFFLPYLLSAHRKLKF